MDATVAVNNYGNEVDTLLLICPSPLNYMDYDAISEFTNLKKRKIHYLFWLIRSFRRRARDVQLYDDSYSLEIKTKEDVKI